MIEKLLAYAKKENLDLEVFSKRVYQIDVEYLNGKKNRDEISDITSYNVKGNIAGKRIELHLEDISDPVKIINRMKKNAELIDDAKEIPFQAKTKIPNVKKKSIDFDISTIESQLSKYDSFRIENENVKALTLEFIYYQEEIKIQNTLGLNLKDQNEYCNLLSEVVYGKDDNTENDVLFLYNNHLDWDEFAEKIKESIQKCALKQEASSLVSNKYNIVLKNKCVYDLLKIFAISFNAENIQNKTSVLADDFAKKIFSSHVSLIEDPSNEDFICQRFFDNEGTKTQRKYIVKDGIFQTKLYNQKSAKKDNTTSTGNSYGVRNLYLKPEEHSKEELYAAAQNGIYIENFLGLNSGINVMNGEISLQASGRIIANGQLTTSVRDIVLNTNIKELFSNIAMIGNDLEFFDLPGGSPSIFVKDINIAGSKEVKKDE